MSSLIFGFRLKQLLNGHLKFKTQTKMESSASFFVKSSDTKFTICENSRFLSGRLRTTFSASKALFITSMI